MSNPYYEQLQKESDGTIQKLEWVSVKDRLPAKTEKFLVIDPTYESSIKILFFSERIKSFVETDTRGYAYPNRYITHWMPLPELPEVGV